MCFLNDFFLPGNVEQFIHHLKYAYQRANKLLSTLSKPVSRCECVVHCVSKAPPREFPTSSCKRRANEELELELGSLRSRV